MKSANQSGTYEYEYIQLSFTHETVARVNRLISLVRVSEWMNEWMNLKETIIWEKSIQHPIQRTTKSQSIDCDA